MTLSQYFICFIVYSFLGWVYESLFYTFQFKKPVNTGFLHGCFCPIYGLACVLNIRLIGGMRSDILIFISSMVMISAVEYIVSYTLEYIFGKRWWDYSDWPLNINGRVSLFSSLGFGAMSLVQLRFLQPVIGGIIMRIPVTAVNLIMVMFCAFVLCDLLYTIREMDRSDEKLWFIEEESEVIRQTGEKLEEKKKNMSVRYNDVVSRIKETLSR